MGLAERFKEELKSKNIFEKSNIEKNNYTGRTSSF